MLDAMWSVGRLHYLNETPASLHLFSNSAYKVLLERPPISMDRMHEELLYSGLVKDEELEQSR